MSQSRAYQIRTDVMQESKSCAFSTWRMPYNIILHYLIVKIRNFNCRKRLKLDFFRNICKINSSDISLLQWLNAVVYVFGLIESSRKLLAQRLNRLTLSFLLFTKIIILQTFVLVNAFPEHSFEICSFDIFII